MGHGTDSGTVGRFSIQPHWNWTEVLASYATAAKKLTQKTEHAPCFWKKHKTSRSHQSLQTFWGVYLFHSKKHCSQRHGFRLVGRSDGCLPVAVGFNHTWTAKKADHVGGWESQHEKLATKPFSTRFWFPWFGKRLDTTTPKSWLLVQEVCREALKPVAFGKEGCTIGKGFKSPCQNFWDPFGWS